MTGSYALLPWQDREQIEQQIAYHRNEIARLSRRLNTDARVMRLPDELLAEVFAQYVSAWRADKLLNTRPYGWLPITHVCHNWREIALHTPLLWTDVHLTARTDPTTAFIDRSCQADLHVRGHLTFTESGGHVDAYDQWRPLSQASCRIRSLWLDIHTEILPFPTASSCVVPFSGLKHLVLGGPPLIKQLPLFLSPETIFLQSLTAYHVAFTTIRPLLRTSLRSLSLRRFCISKTSWATFFDTLRDLTSLEQLVLADNFVPLPARFMELPLVAGTVVTLPSLRSLSLSAEVAAAAGLLLRHLFFSGRAALAISYGERFAEDGPLREIDPDEDTPCLASAVSLRLSGETTLTSPPPIHTLCIGNDRQRYDAGIPRIAGWPRALSLDEMTSSLTAPLFCIEGEYDFPALVSRLGQIRSFIHVQTLILSAFNHLTARSLREAFAHLPSLSAIRARDSSVFSLLSAMLPDRLSDDVPFAALRQLQIHNFLFYYSDWDGENNEGVQALEATLSQRSLRGCRLDKLIITECRRIQHADVEGFREYVGLLTWDGVS